MHRRAALLATTSALLAPRAWSQTPTTRLVVPYPPGGPLDIVARLLAERTKDSLGSVVVENRPGAGGNLGANAVAKAAPDGQTLVMGAVATHAINPWLYAKIPYDAVRDFTDVRDMVRAYWLLLARGDPGRTYNAASGKAVSIREVIEGFLVRATRPIEVRQVAERVRPIDLPLLMGDASRLRALTGWAPTISFRQSLEDVLDDWRRRV